MREYLAFLGTRRKLLRFFGIVAGVAALLFFAFCTGNKNGGYRPEYTAKPAMKSSAYIFAVHPLYNPQHLQETYGLLIDYLNRHIVGAKFELEASRSFETFEQKLYGRRFHFAFANPYEAINSLNYGYRVYGKMGDDEQFRGIILVRKDSGINTVADLKGKTISFPSPTNVAATMMPLYYLHTHGLDVNHDIRRLFTGTHDSSIMSVYLRQSAAGATRPLLWVAFEARYPKEAAALVVKWETPPLVDNALVVRDDVPQKVVDQVAALLFALHTHEEGRKLLAALPLSRFESATNETYKPVYDFLEKYNAVVH